MKILFICNQNQNRSKTAEELFGNQFETHSAGLYNKDPLTAEDLAWADAVVVMEDDHRKAIAERFPALYMAKRILALDIPDIYTYQQPELIELLRSQMNALIEEYGFIR